MFIGFWEMMLIALTLIILFLPELSRKSRSDAGHRLRLYIVIGLMLVVIVVLSRTIFKVLTLMVAMAGLAILLILVTLNALMKRR
ncbi:MAG: hypothetical protein ACUVTM_08535 [Candidatus Bathyarchaeia archaeon]